MTRRSLYGLFRSLRDLFFGQEVAKSFDHQDGVFSSGEDEVELGVFHLFRCRIDDEFAVDHSDADSADRFYEGNIGNDEGGRGGANSQNVGLVQSIVREDVSENLDFIVIALFEHGAERAVDQAAG